MEIPFLDLKKQYADHKKEIDLAIHTIISQGTFILGKPVQDFEEHISALLGQKSLGCASGTDALLMALMAIDIKPGDEVITTPFTFFATAGVIARLGAKPVYVDIDAKTFNIDPTKIEKAITKKTKAIIPVHLFGQSVDMDLIMQIAAKHNLIVIEDACQAIGATYKGKMLGTIGHFGCFSFFPTKNLGAYGDGGLITAKSEKEYALLRTLRVHGSEKKYFHERVGLNSRLDALQASILDVKLPHLEVWNKKRQAIAKKYSEKLKAVVQIPTLQSNATHVYHQYAIVVEKEKRYDLMYYLKEKKIETGIYYPLPLHLQTCFKDLGYKKGDFPNSELLSETILSLPIFPEMTDEQVDYVIDSILGFFEK
jgi:dTDP-4-amino-4,6-dideoxygalactose transaminase